MNGKTNLLQSALESIFSFTLTLGIVLIPLLFWNLTSEFYETPKFLALAFLTGILLLIWALKCLISGKITMTKTPLDLPLLAILLVSLISTIFAVSKPVAIFGNFPRINGGLASFIPLILFYFVVVSNLKQIGVIKQIINLLVGVGTVLSVLTLFSYWGLNLLSFPWTKALNFTPTGSSFSTAAILILLMPPLLLSILQDKENDLLRLNQISPLVLTLLFQKVILSLILTLFAVTIALTGSLPIYLAATAALVLTLWTSFSPSSFKKNLPFLALPVVLALLLIFLSQTPVLGSKNIFYAQAQKFPQELQLSPIASWKISVSAFRDSPLWGSGPGSYLANFTFYKPLEFNTSKVWNIRFDQAFNEYLQILGTLGALGFLALLFFTFAFLSVAFKTLAQSEGSLDLGLAISGILFFLLLALHASTLALYTFGLLILALFLAKNKHGTQEIQINLSTNHSPVVNRQTNEFYLPFDVLPVVFMMIIIAFVGSAFYFIGKAAQADYYHRQALQAVAQGKGLEAYNHLILAEQLNPYLDLYRTDLAQTNFALANAIAMAKGPASTRGEPTESSPSGSLTDQDKQNIQTLLSQAITEARTATALNPLSPLNWEILGSIYRQISGVAQNALTFSLDSYGRAIQRDPLNPLLRLTVGGIYYSVKNYDLAVRFFTDAVNLKPDFANGYYNLATALREKGDLAGAASSAERTVSLLDPKNQDYQTASNLLAQLKDQIATEAARQQAQQKEKIQAPAAQESSALQGKNLPKILELPKPENIATPEAVKKQNQK